jgi:5-methylcytosine-specific restriction endonuclease McrA
MNPSQFRSTAQWQRARQRKLAGATQCSICLRRLRPDLGPRHKLAPSVDHLVELDRINLNTEAGRRQACDPAMLRVTCIGCNSRRGSQYVAAKRGWPRIYNLNEIVARRQAAEQRRSERW